MAEMGRYCLDALKGARATGSAKGALFACLEDAASKPEDADAFSEPCRTAVVKVGTKRGRDYRLSWRLKSRCAPFVSQLCREEAGLVAQAEEKQETSGLGEVIACLEAKRDEILAGIAGHDTATAKQGRACSMEVDRYVRRGQKNVGANFKLADACVDDIYDFCGQVPADKVFPCLVKNRGGLAGACAKRVGKMMEARQHDISINVDIAQNCAGDVPVFCAHTTHNKGLIVECLAQNRNDPAMSTACRTTILEQAVAVASDWRLNYRHVYKIAYAAGRREVLQVRRLKCVGLGSLTIWAMHV